MYTCPHCGKATFVGSGTCNHCDGWKPSLAGYSTHSANTWRALAGEILELQRG